MLSCKGEKEKRERKKYSLANVVFHTIIVNKPKSQIGGNKKQWGKGIINKLFL